MFLIFALLLACAWFEPSHGQGTQHPVLGCGIDIPTLLEAPVLAPRCEVPDKLEFDDTLDSYVPNPFTVRMTCVNNGRTPACDVFGSIILPPGVEFDPPGQQTTRRFYPQPMEPWGIGDPIPELTWTVRWVPRLREEARPVFCFAVTGKNFGGVRLDTTMVRDSVRIPGLRPLFSGRIYLPDSLGVRADGRDVEPNPFPVRVVMQNISHQVGSLRRVVLQFPTSDGLLLNPDSPWPASADVDIPLAPGESFPFDWLIDVKNRSTRRNVQITVIVYDDEGNPMPHDEWLPIANLDWEARSSCVTSDTLLSFDKPRQQYEPETFIITGTVWNAGGLDLHDIRARITWDQPRGLDLIEADPEHSDTSNPKMHDLLLPGDSAQFVWGFRIRNWNRTWERQFVTFSLHVDSREHPGAHNEATRVEIAPCNILVDVTPLTPQHCELLPVHPNPVYSSTVIRFSLSRASPVHLLVTDVLGRPVLRLIDGEIRKAGEHAMHVDAAGLPEGAYFIRLVAGDDTRIRRMLKLR
jgi:hypothetical protein